MQPTEIHEIAARFRLAIEARQRTLRLSWLRDNFPTGCCREASDMLGTLLRERYGIEAAVVLGEIDDHSHAWLEIDGLIVDITADQFADRFPNAKPVIVTRDRAMHSQFGGNKRVAPVLLGADDDENEFAADAQHDYSTIVEAFYEVGQLR